MSTSTEIGETTRPKAWRWFARPEVAIFLLVLVFAGPVIHHWGEQQISRYVLTASLWNEQTVVVDQYAQLMGRDHAIVDGVTYSDKAPGQPFLAVPFYGIYRLLGGESPDVFDPETDLGMWWVTLWTAALPGAILAVLMYRWAREVEETKALQATLTMFFGTLLLVYSTILFAHVLAALFAFGMFLIIRKPNLSWQKLVLAGLLGGAAVAVEYPVALIVAVLVVAAAFKHRGRVMLVVAGGVIPALFLGWYHYRLFGDPLTFTYQWSAFSGTKTEARSAFGIFAGPTLQRFVHVLVSPRGLLVATPVLAVGALGFVPMWRKALRFDVIVAITSILVTLAIPFSWANSYAGGAGPRYFVPALPFFAAPLAAAWVRWGLLARVTAFVSIVTMVAATLTEPQLGTEFEAGVRYWLGLAVAGDFEPTVYSVAFPSLGWVLFVSAVLAALYFCYRNKDPMVGDRVSEPTSV